MEYHESRVWVEGVSDSRRKVIVGRGRAETRHIEVGLLQVYAHLFKNLLDQALGLIVVNKAGLNVREDLRVFFDRYVV